MRDQTISSPPCVETCTGCLVQLEETEGGNNRSITYNWIVSCILIIIIIIIFIVIIVIIIIIIIIVIIHPTEKGVQ